MVAGALLLIDCRIEEPVTFSFPAWLVAEALVNGVVFPDQLEAKPQKDRHPFCEYDRTYYH